MSETQNELIVEEIVFLNENYNSLEFHVSHPIIVYGEILAATITESTRDRIVLRIVFKRQVKDA